MNPIYNLSYNRKIIIINHNTRFESSIHHHHHHQSIDNIIMSKRTIFSHQYPPSSRECQRYDVIAPSSAGSENLITSLKVALVKSSPLQDRIWSPGLKPASRAMPPSRINCTNMPGFHSGPLQILK